MLLTIRGKSLGRAIKKPLAANATTPHGRRGSYNLCEGHVKEKKAVPVQKGSRRAQRKGVGLTAEKIESAIQPVSLGKVLVLGGVYLGWTGHCESG